MRASQTRHKRVTNAASRTRTLPVTQEITVYIGYYNGDYFYIGYYPHELNHSAHELNYSVHQLLCALTDPRTLNLNPL